MKPISDEFSSVVLTSSKVKECLKMAFDTKTPVFIWGPAGIGKSAVVSQCGKECGRDVKVITLSSWDQSDIKGIPYFDSNVGTATWAQPSEFPKKGSTSNTILFFDELNCASPQTLNALFTLIQDRHVGEYVLPDGVDIVCAGNRETDRGVVFTIPSPLLNRLTHISMKVSYEDWVEWAAENKIEPAILSYMSQYKRDLHTFEPAAKMKAFATPRSWEKVDRFLKYRKEHEISDVALSSMISGAVGVGVGMKFMSYLSIADKIPSVEMILDGTLTSVDYKSITSKLENATIISIDYSLMIAIAYELKRRYDLCLNSDSDELYVSSFENMITFLHSNYLNVKSEFIILCLRTILKRFSLPRIEFTRDEITKQYFDISKLFLKSVS